MKSSRKEMLARTLFPVLMLLTAAACCAEPDHARDGNNAPDYAREKRWAEEITPGLVVGDAVYLTQKSGHKFLAIYAGTSQARAAVILCMASACIPTGD